MDDLDDEGLRKRASVDISTAHSNMTDNKDEQSIKVGVDEHASLAREAGLPPGWRKVPNDFGTSHSKYTAPDGNEFEHLEDALSYAQQEDALDQEHNPLLGEESGLAYSEDGVSAAEPNKEGFTHIFSIS